MDFPRGAIEGSLQARFEAQVRHAPDQPALRCGGLAWTYRELNRCANLVARGFPPAAGETPPVPLLLGHGALEVITLLAVLKSGRAYVALDPRSPPARLRAIAADVGAGLLLTSRAHAPLAARLATEVVELPGAATLLAAARDPDLAAALDRDPGLDMPPDALASLVYTSGSTGTPKGVMRSHRGSLHRCWLFRRDQQVGAGERIAHMFGCGFVAAEVDVYGALLNGGTLCCYPVRDLGFAPLADWLAAERISLLHVPPALWRQFLDNLAGPPDLPALRTVFLAGEAVFRRDVEMTRRLFPACTIEHRLSSSEASVIAQYRIAPEDRVDDEVLPAGAPVPDKEILLLDPAGREVPPGEPGEIVVRSRYLSPGYWRRPDLTASRFIPVPDAGDGEASGPPLRCFHTGDLGRFSADGTRLHHLGRLDEQVKVRGYRVEPGEVEAALLGLDLVMAAAVVPRPDAGGDSSLVACVVARPGVPVTAAALRARLAEVLPDYLIPSRFEFLPVLPLTPNGKIDRLALAGAGPVAEPTPASPPRAGTEEGIALIWREVLRLERLDRTDDFFSLGGNSLLAARVVARLNEACHLSLPLVSLYQAPTIAGLAALIESAGAVDRPAETGMDPARALPLLEKF